MVLVLAALYENVIDPLIIVITVPLALLGAVLAWPCGGFPSMSTARWACSCW